MNPYPDKLTEEQFKFIINGIKDDVKWNLDENGLLNVEGSFNCSLIENFKGFNGLRFGKIQGNFIASNIGLVSLEGGPVYVGKDCRYENNKIVSTKFSPKFIGRNFYIQSNKIVCLEEFPESRSNSYYNNTLNNSTIYDISEYMYNHKTIFEMALVNVWDKIVDKDKELLNPYYPENPSLYKDINDYSII